MKTETVKIKITVKGQGYEEEDIATLTRTQVRAFKKYCERKKLRTNKAIQALIMESRIAVNETVDLPPKLVEAGERLAKKRGVTFNELVEETLEEALAEVA